MAEQNNNGGGNRDDNRGGNRGGVGRSNADAGVGVMSQKDAVYKAICEVKGTEQFDTEVQLSDEERERVKDRVTEMFESGEVGFAREDDVRDRDEIHKYATGLVSNWLRKDERLNGHTRYEPQTHRGEQNTKTSTNQGEQNTRTSSNEGDATLRALRALLSAQTDPNAKRDIQAEIDKRLKELRPISQKIDVDALPPHLRHYATEH